MDALIGRRMMDRVKDSAGRDVFIYEPSMATYIVHSEHRAVPIYPHDANTIVAMMDLHPERPGEVYDPADEPFEVFEAGTGAASLTLHIARALHAGNPSLGRRLREAIPTAKTTAIHRPSKSDESAEGAVTTTTLASLDLGDPSLREEAEAYLPTRRAILHTLDRKALHSFEAHNLVRRFRRGIYLPNIDFHTGSISSYLTPRLASRNGRPFLSRAVLDLPSPEDNADPVISALRPNGTLIVFSPSISQIAGFAAWSVEGAKPLKLDRVAELPTSSSAEYGVQECEGGRAWNLSTTVPKGEDGEDGGGRRVVQIMRPRVGDRIAGGGFVAVFRKMNERVGEDAAGVAEEVSSEDVADEGIPVEVEKNDDSPKDDSRNV
ncbi:hypothetical protein ACRE_079630 [Hapsidospora chrysogenum ATCC 11550]|uniref:tRNA (adenine(58)-N(1))-methyltransferase catalytic subunit TRM61 n=1 Tax=Hapsidospora chrysogenum (strain ATCC 11550 / CBS 779.69 / DSM 880 / IAM 14645 / JCM 23072 / IMI 49137) TaxID=857340 RepID=A0A086SW45_HAPC1|nr:hypothetical protein ACRE_079630 [Hapsidospora chrysogenum ATCC 11550]